ncbi:MAG: Y-family DNA polymerase [Candidatus Gracilibacteria bacterium]
MIAIVDCNNFYASCERAFDPAMRGKPICILSNNDGCVIARSDEAKALDIPMGAAYHMWKDKFKEKSIEVFSSNYALYGDMSARVMKVLRSAVSRVEVYSIDEAFLDLRDVENPYLFCEELSKTVYQFTGIPVSIGIAPSKTLAKVANRLGKKLKKKAYQVSAHEYRDLLRDFPVGEVWGIGRKHTKFLHANGIRTALQLADMHDSWIKKQLKTPGLWTAMELRGIPCFPFETEIMPKKMIMESRSFGYKLTDKQIISEAIASHVARAAEKLRKQGSLAGAVAVCLNTDRFSTTTKYSRTSGYKSFPVATADTAKMIRTALEVLDEIFYPNIPYQKAGIRLGEIIPETALQCSFWNAGDTEKQSKALKTIDECNQLYGKDSIFFGAMGTEKKWALRANFLSSRYTTSFSELLRIRI